MQTISSITHLLRTRARLVGLMWVLAMRGVAWSQGTVQPQPVQGYPLVSPFDQPIRELIASMSLEQKVGQMTQLNLDAVSVGAIYQLQEPHRLDSAKLWEALRIRHVGSLLNCGGHAYDLQHWRSMLSEVQRVNRQK